MVVFRIVDLFKTWVHDTIRQKAGTTSDVSAFPTRCSWNTRENLVKGENLQAVSLSDFGVKYRDA